jgi:hypothetical protein
VGQILDAKPILVFDHISQNETKRVSLHHLVKLSFIKKRKVWRKEETFSGILSEYFDSSHFEHLFHWRRVIDRNGLDGFNLSAELSDFLF